MKQHDDNQRVECNVDFFDSCNSGAFSYSGYSLIDLGITRNKSRPWDVSNVKSQEKSLI
jgi:hypothetical protein